VIYEKEFELLVQANEDRENALMYEGTKKALRKEKEYLKYIETYAKNRTFLDLSLQVLENNDSSSAVLLEVCKVLLSCDDDALITQTISLVCTEESNMDMHKALSILPETKQLLCIDKLLSLNNKKSLTFAGKCIVANGYRQYVQYFHNEGKVVELEEENVACAVLSRLGGEKEKAIVESLFLNTKHPIKKELIALELIHAKSYKAREYIKEFNSLDSFAIFPFLSLSGDMELYKDELTQRIADGEIDFVEAYSKITIWYGNPRLIPFYIDMLTNIDVCMQFNELLLRFFYYDENMEPLENVMEKWEEYLEEIDGIYSDDTVKYDELFKNESKRVQTYIIDFWKSKENYIHQTINMDKKYYIDEPFDILEIWKDAMDDFYLSEATVLHKGIQLLTGEYFAFDIEGLRSRQLVQSQLIIEYFKEYKKILKKGTWYVWGKTTEKELKSFLIDNDNELMQVRSVEKNTIPEDFLK